MQNPIHAPLTGMIFHLYIKSYQLEHNEKYILIV